jgi:hypothetical protein
MFVKAKNGLALERMHAPAIRRIDYNVSSLREGTDPFPESNSTTEEHGGGHHEKIRAEGRH